MRLFTIVFVVAFTVSTAQAGAPQLISFQGLLTDNAGDPVNDASYSVTFTIYDDPGTGASVWSETQNVSTIGGQFSVMLGSVNPILDTVFNGTTRYLGIAIGSDPELSPRTALVSVPFAHRVSTIDGSSGGFLSSDLVVGNELGDSLVIVGVDIDGGGAVSFSDPASSSPAGRVVALQEKVKITTDGVIFFGATSSDTTLCLFNNGDIASIGQITMGASSSGAVWGTVFGYTNTASGDSSTVSGGHHNVASGAMSTVSGGQWNIASGGTSVVSGGSANEATSSSSSVGGGSGNEAHGPGSRISGGDVNKAHGFWSTVGGGGNNIIDSASQSSTIGGGEYNHAGNGQFTEIGATVAGGRRNLARSRASTVGGGQYDTAYFGYSTVPGGQYNTARGYGSFAAGKNAKADHLGAIVFSDYTVNDDQEFHSTANQQFSVRARGGTRIYSDSTETAGVTLAAGSSTWASVSDSARKTDIREVNLDELLGKLSAVPITRWKYKSEASQIDHIGPMAQDFYAAFGVGEDDKHITTVDADGVALAAIQGLIEKNSKLETEVAELRRLVQELMKSMVND